MSIEDTAVKTGDGSVTTLGQICAERGVPIKWIEDSVASGAPLAQAILVAGGDLVLVDEQVLQKETETRAADAALNEILDAFSGAFFGALETAPETAKQNAIVKLYEFYMTAKNFLVEDRNATETPPKLPRNSPETQTETPSEKPAGPRYPRHARFHKLAGRVVIRQEFADRLGTIPQMIRHWSDKLGQSDEWIELYYTNGEGYIWPE